MHLYPKMFYINRTLVLHICNIYWVYVVVVGYRICLNINANRVDLLCTCRINQSRRSLGHHSASSPSWSLTYYVCLRYVIIVLLRWLMGGRRFKINYKKNSRRARNFNFSDPTPEVTTFNYSFFTVSKFSIGLFIGTQPNDSWNRTTNLLFKINNNTNKYVFIAWKPVFITTKHVYIISKQVLLL